MSTIVAALREIAAMTFDPWTNGAKAGEIARAALAEVNDAQPAPQQDPPMLATLADAYDAVQQERTERERFEAWWDAHISSGLYTSEAAWLAWQAAQRKP